MSNVASLGALRSRLGDDPAKISPRDCLLEVIEQLDSGELKVRHIMVVSAIDHENEDTQVQINHAGTYNRHAQYGMLFDALETMRDT